MEECNYWEFRCQIKEEVKHLLTDDECWELMAMLYLIMQEELFVTFSKHSNFQGTSAELLALIEEEVEMQLIVKTAMVEYINDADGKPAICKALYLLKDQLSHIQVIDDEGE